MKINVILAFVSILASLKRSTCISSSGMNAMFDILYNFRLCVKFSTHMTNNTREKIGFSCTNCFRPLVVLIFVQATALNKFCFRLLRNNDQFSSGVTSIFDCSLKTIKNVVFKVLQKSFLIMVRATTWYNFLSIDQLLFGNLWVQ